MRSSSTLLNAAALAALASLATLAALPAHAATIDAINGAASPPFVY